MKPHVLFATKADQTLVKMLLDAIGLSIKVPETLLDAVMVMSVSGPAIVFHYIEALSDGGVRVGLSWNVSTIMASQAVKGTSEKVLHTVEH